MSQKSKVQWEYNLVERPFCEQLRAMGWEWIEDDVDVPELTERESFRKACVQRREQLFKASRF